MSFPRRAAVARAAVALALVFPPSLAAPPSTQAASDTDWPFVYRVGGELYLEGAPFLFSGFNIYYANNLRNDGCSNLPLGQGSELAAELEEWGSGFNVLRTWFFQNLAQTDIAEDGGVRDWSAFDHTLAAADAAGLKVIATLTDQVGECGDGGVNGFKTNTWYESGYRDGVDYGNLVPYRDWVREIVSRYRDDPRIAFWQLINEGEVKASATAACLPDGQSFPVFRDWAADVSALVKSIDPNHLVSLGTMGGGQCGAQYTEYEDLHELPAIDLCEYHDYSPNQAMPGDQWNGLAFRVQQCAALDKPLFVGEVGITPNDLTTAGGVEGRAVAFDDKLREQRALGIDGHVAWAWVVGPSRTDTFDIGAGDPVLQVLPHAPSTTTELVSVSSSGAQGNEDSGNAVGGIDISADGRVSVYSSLATSLATGVAPGPNVLVRDRARGTTELAAVAVGGAEPNSFSHAPAVSATGRHVAFLSFASNLVAADANGLVDVFVRDRVRGTTARVSVATDGTEMSGDSAFGTPDISANGRYVVFASQGSRLVPEITAPSFSRIYLHDRDTDNDGQFDEAGAIATRQVTVATDGTLANGASYRPTISSSGRFIAFHSEADNLVPGDLWACEEAVPTSTAGPESSAEPPQPRNCIDVFVLDRDTDADGTFDEAGGTGLEISSRTSDGTQANGDSYSPAIADDGDVAFATQALNLGSDASFTVVVKDRPSQAVSVIGTGLANLASISASSRYVGFDSAGANGTDDASGASDAFVHDRASGANAIVNLGTDGTQAGQGAYLPTFSRDGRFVAFGSLSTSLVAEDTNARADVFVRDRAAVPDPPGHTGVGSLVSVTPPYAPSGSEPVEVRFDHVTGAGVTTVSKPGDLEPSPDGYVFDDSALTWLVESTASFSGQIRVCLTYEDGDVREPDGVLLQRTAAGWLEVTASRDPVANEICGITSSLGTFAVGMPGVPTLFVETTDLPTNDHAILWIAESIDPTSVPRPDDFTLTIGDSDEAVTDVEIVYQGLVGSQLLVDGLGFERGSTFVELRWTTDAPADAEILLDYAPGTHPFRTPEGMQVAPFQDQALVRWQSGVIATAFVDEGAGPDQVVVFLDWQLDTPLPDAGDFTVEVTNRGVTMTPTGITRRASHLGATFLYLQLPGEVLPDDEVTLRYAAGSDPILLPDGSPFIGVLDDRAFVSLSPTSSRLTPPGENVTVTPKENTSGAEYATLEFSSVTGAGTTTLTATEDAPELPAGFTLGDPPTYYDIETTAAYDGAVTVCIRYGAADYTDPSTIRLFHYEEGAWADVTTSHDPATQTVCGVVTNLSPFAVVERAYDVAGYFAPVDRPPTLNTVKAGSAVPMKFRLGGDFGLDIFTDGTPASRRVSCPSEAPIDAIETTTSSRSGLSYDAAANEYTYVWKTEKGWAGSCREFTATFENGESLTAVFRFNR